MIINRRSISEQPLIFDGRSQTIGTIKYEGGFKYGGGYELASKVFIIKLDLASRIQPWWMPMPEQPQRLWGVQAYKVAG